MSYVTRSNSGLGIDYWPVSIVATSVVGLFVSCILTYGRAYKLENRTSGQPRAHSGHDRAKQSPPSFPGAGRGAGGGLVPHVYMG